MNEKEEKLGDRCKCCSHTRLAHGTGDQYGKCFEPPADGDGLCPCNGFELKLTVPS